MINTVISEALINYSYKLNSMNIISAYDRTKSLASVFPAYYFYLVLFVFCNPIRSRARSM